MSASRTPTALHNSTTIVLIAATAAVGCTLCPAQVPTSDPGPYEPGYTTISLERPDNSDFDVLVYYPATAAGEGAPYDGSGAPYPAVVFGHGFVTPATKYLSTLEHLTSWGYFVLAPRSWESLFPLPDHAEYALDMRRCFDWLEQQNGDPGAPLFEQVDTDAFGLSGHSMGGGASILATAGDPRIKALANLAAAETDPSAVAAMPAIDVPVRLIVGDEDTIVPLEDHTLLMFNAANSPRQMPVIYGASHCGFLDSDIIFCDSGSLPREEQLALTHALLRDFFDLYLKDQQVAWREVWGPEYLANASYDTSYFDPGIELVPDQVDLAGAPGTTFNLAFTVYNTGDFATSFTLLVEDNVFPVTFTPPQTPSVDPGASTVVMATVEIPTDPGRGMDAPLISARADRDGGTREFARMTISVRQIGDLNCDGDVDFDDISPFVLALSGQAAYEAEYPDCDWLLADANQDGEVDFDDINPFVDLIGS